MPTQGEICDLSNQNLIRVPALPCNLTNVTNLILRNNLQLQLDFSSFANLQNLTTLYLTNCSLTYIDILFFEKTQISLLYLDINPLKCPCGAIKEYPPVVASGHPICLETCEEQAGPNVPISVITMICIAVAVGLVAILPI